MRCGYIADGDSLFRQSIHPLSFKSKVFAWERCLNFNHNPSGSLLTSLSWQRYVPTTELVHDYGCRLAFRINEKRRAEGKTKDRNRHVYCGAYHLKGSAIRALSAADGLNEILSADVVHRAEDGEIAHADLIIVLRPGGEVNIEGTKTAILDRLWNTCHGPLKHICDCDKDITVHPSSDLITSPAGPYSDTRSYFLRLWYIVRFRICSWLWRSFWLWR